MLMWRAGPVLIGFFVLLFALLGLLGEGVEYAMTRLIGPHGLNEFWVLWDDALFLIPALLIEPLRIALVASGYDETLRRLVPDADQSSRKRMKGGNMVGADSSLLTSTSAVNGPASSGTTNASEPS